VGRAIRAAVLVSWPWLLIASDAVKWMPFFTRLREKKHRILLSPSVSAVNDGIGCLSDSFFSSCFQSVDSSSNVSLSFWYNCNGWDVRTSFWKHKYAFLYRIILC